MTDEEDAEIERRLEDVLRRGLQRNLNRGIREGLASVPPEHTDIDIGVHVHRETAAQFRSELEMAGLKLKRIKRPF